MLKRRHRRHQPILDHLDERCLLTGYTPTQITSAYGLSGLAFSAGAQTADGTGKTIALIEMYHDPNLTSDLAVFDSAYGLSAPPNITVDNQAGTHTDNGWALEESMDVEWAHAIAPGANILVVEASPSNSDSQALANLMTAVQTANSTPGVAVISMSWGFNEFVGETAYDSDFTTPGVTYIAASGDNPGVDYPAASPYVLSVGGTTLNLNNSGTKLSESAWDESGGGYSQFEAEPSYQLAVQQTGQRSTPDVSFVGDPNTGVEVYETPPENQNPWQQTSQGSWQVVGGTSLGAPAWAGILAIVDQGRSGSGEESLSGATQTLPSLYNLKSDFNAVTSTHPGGTISEFPWEGFGGWDTAWGLVNGNTTASETATANTQTGLGTPNGTSLVANLVSSTTTTPLTTTSSLTPTPTATPAPLPTPPTGSGHHHHKKTTHTPKQTKNENRIRVVLGKRIALQGSNTKKTLVDSRDHPGS